MKATFSGCQLFIQVGAKLNAISCVGIYLYRDKCFKQCTLLFFNYTIRRILYVNRVLRIRPQSSFVQFGNYAKAALNIKRKQFLNIITWISYVAA